jgi:hypothetical protein
LDGPPPEAEVAGLQMTVNARVAFGSTWTVLRGCADGATRLIAKLAMPTSDPASEDEIRHSVFNEFNVLTTALEDLLGEITPSFYGMYGSVQSGHEVWASIWQDGGKRIDLTGLPLCTK